MLVPALPQHPQTLKIAAYLRPRLAVRRRQPVAQRPVRKAKPEAVDQLRMGETALFQIGQRIGIGAQGAGVITRHLLQQLAIPGS